MSKMDELMSKMNELATISIADFIVDITETYKKKLKLQDWDIKVSIISPADWQMMGKIGASFIDEQKKIANIHLLYEPEVFNPDEITKTLIHELLHIVMMPFTNLFSRVIEEVDSKQQTHLLFELAQEQEEMLIEILSDAVC